MRIYNLKGHGKAGVEPDGGSETNRGEGRNVEGQDRSGGLLGKGMKVQISAKSREAKYRRRRRSLEVVSLGRAQNNHDVHLTISRG